MFVGGVWGLNAIPRPVFYIQNLVHSRVVRGPLASRIDTAKVPPRPPTDLDVDRPGKCQALGRCSCSSFPSCWDIRIVHTLAHEPPDGNSQLEAGQSLSRELGWRHECWLKRKTLELGKLGGSLLAVDGHSFFLT